MKLKASTVYDCSVIDVSKVHNDAGNITVVENGHNIPFEVKRIYYLYDVPSGEARGGHAHYELEQFIIAASGSFDVIIDDGINKKRVSLNRPNLALHIVPGLWRELDNFSSGSICMVLASHKYEESDYIRDYNEFMELKK
ncbi:FdtA/QdtA family cupin domain-containing protein [Mariniflexile litorale]|uniref:FdtA/QdtA family cupin domain-containing protein n=1 Tax=Mariniflexile litorale TaxID=3045158 RepID=A0AAU7ECS8_9FLAO|nr:FdtA/QdtA family cupin domain-containing protein [Mariniflexile sp. KMM 9835]MDQ8211499.1 FdtA/QdtA family cupin domain-containing protein [Mariniflexile sp. KMM 9835]